MTSPGLRQKPAMPYWMEQGEIKSWTEKINRVRRAHAQRHGTVPNGNSQNHEKNGHAKVTPCVFYNKDSCMQKHSHETKGVLYKHVCASCWSKEGKSFSHAQEDCNKPRQEQVKGTHMLGVPMQIDMSQIPIMTCTK